MNFENIEATVKALIEKMHAMSVDYSTWAILVDQYIETLKDKSAEELELSYAKKALIKSFEQALSAIVSKAFNVKDSTIDVGSYAKILAKIGQNSNEIWITDSDVNEIAIEIRTFIGAMSTKSTNQTDDFDNETHSAQNEAHFESIIIPKLESLKKTLSIHKEETAVVDTLQLIMDTLRKKVGLNAKFRHKLDKTTSKKPSENAKQRLEYFDAKTLDVIQSYENLDFGDTQAVDSLIKETLKLIKNLEGLNRRIEAKREDDPIQQSTQSTQTNPTTQPNQTRTVVKYDKDFAVQRSNGPISNPTTEKPFKLPTAVKYLIVGAVGAALTVAIFMGIQKSQNHEEPTSNNHTGYEDEADALLENWSKNSINVTKEEMIEIMNVLNGEDSTYTLNQADMVIMNSLSEVCSKALSGEEASSIDFVSLLSDDIPGIAGLKKMQDCLDGCINDPENQKLYLTNALTLQARILGEGETVDGISFSENTTTNPQVRIIWARLAMGVNLFMKSDIFVEVNGNIYMADDLIDNVELTNRITEAKNEISPEKRIGLN